MYRALWSWIVCVVVTVVVSLLTKPKPESELTGLVYGCTDDARRRATCRSTSGRCSGRCVVGVVFVALNVIFW